MTIVVQEKTKQKPTEQAKKQANKKTNPNISYTTEKERLQGMPTCA